MASLFSEQDRHLLSLTYGHPRLMVENPIFTTPARHLFFPIGLFNYGRVRPIMLVRANELDAWECIEHGNVKSINLQGSPMFQNFTVFFICFNYETKRYEGEYKDHKLLYVYDILPVAKTSKQLEEITRFLSKKWSHNNYYYSLIELAWFLYHNQPDENNRFREICFRGDKFEIHDEGQPPSINNLHQLFFE